jgi:hypothetical protein
MNITDLSINNTINSNNNANIINNKISINKTINDIFENNKLKHLNKNLGRRQCLNDCNFVLIYLFHLLLF